MTAWRLCRHCGTRLRRGDRGAWLDARPWQRGGTWDFCPGTPQTPDERERLNGGHEPAVT